MATKFTTSVNIIRDSERELNYIPTPNAIRIVNQIANDFKKGVRSFNIIGSYGTGKSAFLWAFQQSITGRKKHFSINILPNPTIDFINIVGEYKSLKDSFAEVFELKNNKNLTENIFSEIFNKYHDLGRRNSILFLVIEGLEKKNIILFRNYSKRFILFEGTELDISLGTNGIADKVNDKINLDIPLPLQRTRQTHRHGRAIRCNLFSQRTTPTQKKGFPLLSLMQNTVSDKIYKSTLNAAA